MKTMNKQKKVILKTWLVALGVMMLLLSFQFAGASRLYAYSNGDEMRKSGFTPITLNFGGTDIVGWGAPVVQGGAGYKNYQFDLFSGASNGADVTPYFDTVFIACSAHLTWGTSNKSKFVISGSDKIFTYSKESASDTAPRNGYLESKFTLSDALLTAGQKGYLQIDTRVGFYSVYAEHKNWLGKIVVDDYADQITAQLTGAAGVVFGSANATTTDSNNAATFSVTPGQQANFSNSYSLRLSVKHLGGTWSDWQNTIMNVKNPTITLTTTDITAPSVNYTISEPDVWTQSKTITVNVSDTEAGLDNFVVYDAATGAAVASATGGATSASFVATESDRQYYVVATDNVGNVANTSASPIVTSFIDSAAPTITLAGVENADIFTQTKPVTFALSDTQSGIANVTMTAGGVAFADFVWDGGTVLFTATRNREIYEVTATDNVGRTTTYTYTAENIDTTAPVVTLALEPDQIFKTRDVSFGINIDTTTMQAAEEYYFSYTYRDESGQNVTSERQTLTASTTNISFVAPIEAEYIINIWATDSAGNVLEIHHTIVVQTKCTYSIKSILRGSANGAEIVQQDATIADFYTMIEYDTADFVHNGINYALYKVLVNGIEVDKTLNQFELRKDTLVEVVYRECVTLTITKTNYDYTGEDLAVEYRADNYAGSEVVCAVSQNGAATTLNAVGEYDVTLTLDTADYVGSVTGTATVLIPLVVTPTLEYVYAEGAFTFAVKLDSEIEYSLYFIDCDGNVITTDEARQKSLNAGEYTYTLGIADTDYYIAGEPFGAREVSGIFVVNPQPITLADFSETKEYDGLAYSIPSVFQGYEVAVEYSQNGVVVDPIAAGVYDVKITIVQQNYTGGIVGNLTITKKSLKVTATPQSSEYGEAYAALGVETMGFVAGEDYAFTAQCVALGGKVGKYEINFVEADAENDAILKNYNIEYVSAFYTITKRNAVVRVAPNQQKEYGASEPSEFAYETENVLSDDTLGVSLSRAPGEAVGIYAVTMTGYANDNYDVQFFGDNYKIVARKLIIMADSATKVYDGTNIVPALGYTVRYGEILAEDLATFSLTLRCDAGENVGKYVIYAESTEVDNYEIVFMNNYLFVTPRPVIVTALPATKTYGADDPKLKFLLDGAEVDESLFAGSLSRKSGENVGEYAITLGTLKNKNYSITFESDVLTITKAAVTATIEDASKIYGAKIEPEFTWTVVEGVDASQISGVLTREAGENVGEYAIVGTFTSANYEVTVVNGTFAITPKTAYINLTNQSKIYGAADPQFDFTLYGVLDVDRVAVAESVAISREAGENVGEYTLDATAAHANYTFYVNSATFTINKANATVTLDNMTYQYDGEPKLTSGRLNIEGELSYQITRDGEIVAEAIDAGEYVIEAIFAGDQNHNGAKARATLVIEKADVELKIYKNIFVMKKDGSSQDPILDCPLDSTEYRIVFDDADAGSVGQHAYTIIFNDPNYNSIRGTVQILPIPQNSTAGGNIEFVDGDVDNGDVDLVIEKTEDKNAAQSATDMVVDHTYEIKYNQNGSAQVKVELDYSVGDYSNVFVYAYNDKGEAKLVPYTVQDGKIILSMDAENVKIAIVRQVAGISLVTVVLLAGTCLFIATSTVRRRKKKKLRRILRVA